MKLWKWIAIGAIVGLIGQETGYAQVFPNVILWGKYNSTTNKPIKVDVDGKVVITS